MSAAVWSGVARTLAGPERQTKRAVVVATLCVGGMVVARALDDAALAAEIRRVAEAMAMRAGDLEAVAAAAE